MYRKLMQSCLTLSLLVLIAVPVLAAPEKAKQPELTLAERGAVGYYRSSSEKAAVQGRLVGGDALADQARGAEQALLPHVGVDGGAGLFLEKAHKMVAAQVDPLRQLLHAQLPAQVLVDVAQHFPDLRVDALLAAPLGGVEAPDLNQQLDDPGVAHGLGAVAGVRRGFFVGGQGLPDLPPLRLVRLQQPLAAPVSLVKAVHQPCLRHGAVKVLPVQIEDDALVGLALVDEGFVDGVVPDQQHRPGPQLVALALHQVLHPTRQQQHQLVKVVKMKIPLLSGAVL